MTIGGNDHYVLDHSQNEFWLRDSCCGSKHELLGVCRDKAETDRLDGNDVERRYCRLAGSIEILGINRRFVDSFSPGYGFDGIVVAALSGNNITVLPIFSFFLAVLNQGRLRWSDLQEFPKNC